MCGIEKEGVMNFVRICAGVAAGFLLLAVFPLPYGYYQLMRVVVCGVGIYAGMMMLQRGDNGIAGALFIAAALFNPIVPVHLTRGIWLPLNLIGAGLYGFTAYRSGEGQQRRDRRT